MIGVIICMALIFNHINACVTGVAIPFVMKKLGFDPGAIGHDLRDHVHRLRRIFATLGLAATAHRIGWL